MTGKKRFGFRFYILSKKDNTKPCKKLKQDGSY